MTAPFLLKKNKIYLKIYLNKQAEIWKGRSNVINLIEFGTGRIKKHKC